MRTIATASMLLLSLAVSACSKDKEPEKYTILSAEPEKQATPPPVATTAATTMTSPHAAPPSNGEITWTDPSGWSKRPVTNPMRKGEYTIPKVAGDSDNADCTIFAFGAGQGGPVDQNLDRWIKQFDPAEASSPKRTANTLSNGFKVTTLEMSGTFNGGGGPMMGGPPPQPKPGYRMLAAVVEAPDASTSTYFFKMTGPDKTVKAAIPAFQDMLKSIKKP